MRHCLACAVPGAPGVCGSVALGLCEWVSVRLWSVRVCVSRSRSRRPSLYVCVSGSRAAPGVCAPESSWVSGSLCVRVWVPLLSVCISLGVWGPFVSRCLNPGLSAGGSGERGS